MSHCPLAAVQHPGRCLGRCHFQFDLVAALSDREGLARLAGRWLWLASVRAGEVWKGVVGARVREGKTRCGEYDDGDYNGFSQHHVLLSHGKVQRSAKSGDWPAMGAGANLKARQQRERPTPTRAAKVRYSNSST
jgi:hypothetical protein